MQCGCVCVCVCLNARTHTMAVTQICRSCASWVHCAHVSGDMEASDRMGYMVHLVGGSDVYITLFTYIVTLTNTVAESIYGSLVNTPIKKCAQYNSENARLHGKRTAKRSKRERNK